MTKAKTVFVCSECGYTSQKWLGRCPECGAWNSMTEEMTESVKKTQYSGETATPYKIGEISSEDKKRIKTGVGELDLVLGGGVIPGSMVLVGGEPGIGKSTLLLQICSSLVNNGSVLYVSGEESARQIKLRADRLNINAGDLYILSETDVESVFANLSSLRPSAVIIDSIQTMYCAEISSAAGSVSQVREITMRLMRFAKETATTVFVVGHVTKDGSIAGPRVLEHMVDCVLYFEGDNNNSYRILRAVKNRYGSTNEIGMFEMTDKGLCEVKNPSAALLSERPLDASGSAVLCSIEGSRPILAEVQALVASTVFGIPRRMSSGIDTNRLNLLIAVLEKRVGFNMQNKDTYINIIGGMKIDETAADLAVAAAIVSSFKNALIPHSMIFLGEVGLTGEIRSVSQIQKRVSESQKLGFTDIVLPYENARSLISTEENINIHAVKTLKEAVGIFI